MQVFAWKGTISVGAFLLWLNFSGGRKGIPMPGRSRGAAEYPEEGIQGGYHQRCLTDVVLIQSFSPNRQSSLYPKALGLET